MADMLTEKKLAKKLNVHRVTLLNWRKRGMPHVVTPTGRILYDYKKVESWLTSSSATGGRG